MTSRNKKAYFVSLFFQFFPTICLILLLTERIFFTCLAYIIYFLMMFFAVSYAPKIKYWIYSATISITITALVRYLIFSGETNSDYIKWMLIANFSAFESIPMSIMRTFFGRIAIFSAIIIVYKAVRNFAYKTTWFWQSVKWEMICFFICAPSYFIVSIVHDNSYLDFAYFVNAFGNVWGMILAVSVMLPVFCFAVWKWRSLLSSQNIETIKTIKKVGFSTSLILAVIVIASAWTFISLLLNAKWL